LPGTIRQRRNLHQQVRENEDRIKNLEDQVVVTQKLATLGTMACLVAHEFNNILTPMINYAELALKHQDDTALMRRALEKTIHHGNRAALVIQSMLGLVRDQGKKKQATPLAPLVKECFQCLARDFAKDRITVKMDIPEDLCLFVAPGQMQQVLLNLIINARQAMLDRGGSLTIRARTQGEGNVQIQVVDTGCGITPEIMNRIFEPFFTTKTGAARPDQQGTGLGLMVCRSIVEAHMGAITAASQPGQGATFTISLPHAVVTSQPKDHET